VTAAGAGARTDTTARPGTPEPNRPWRRALRAAGSLWAISHVGYAALFTIAFWSGSGRAPVTRNALSRLDHWDSNWFTRIAVHGYREPDTAAFFPLYPILVRAVDAALPGGALPAALIVSNAAALGALAVLYRLVERDFGRSLADRTAWYLIAFPTAFFLSVGYNESLFLLASASCLYLLRGGRWLAAGLLGGLAAATRSVGVLLLVPFCYEYVRQRGRRPRVDALCAVLIPAGVVAFMLFTRVRFGDPLAFAHAQRHWGRRLDLPWTSFVATARNLAHTHPVLAPEGAHLILDLLVAILLIILLALAFVGPWRMRRDQWALPLYGVALTLAIISFPSFRAESPFPLMSSPRLALEVIPAFVVLARIGERRAAERLYLLVALALQGAAMVQYLNDGWVA
jgi:Mannosyltransferase (PIG-V)